MPPFKKEGANCLANVGRSVGLSDGPSVGIDYIVSDIYFENFLLYSFRFHMLIGPNEDKTIMDFEFPRSTVKVTRVTFVKMNKTGFRSLS